MKLVVFISIGLTVGTVMAAEPVMACTCAAPATSAEGFKRSSVVFKGKVKEINRPLWARLGVSTSGSHRVTFEVFKQWKGSPVSNIDVITRLTGEACGFPFEKNKEYLVYVVSEPKDLQTGICTGTKIVADAGTEMKQLDEIVAGAKR
jgi:hypothetical protein